jgi:hypothetical protein
MDSGMRVVLTVPGALIGAAMAAVSVFSGAPANGAPALTPQDFAYGMPIMATEVAAAYRVQLPVDVYKASVHELGDIRVFNAQGEAVPYVIKHMDVGGSSLRSETPGQILPLSPLRAAAQYLVDARSVEVPIAALQLSWPESSADFSGRMRIECSDDQSTWRTIVSAAPLANLHAGGQRLIENRIETPDTQAKFWRLSWLGVGPSFDLNEVRAEAAQGPPRINWSTLVITGKADPRAPGDYDFDLGASFPLERVNLILPETNSVYLADFKSRAQKEDPWREVIRAGVYRRASADGQDFNGPIEVPLDRDRYWRVHLSGENSAGVPLRFEGSFSPGELEFVAHGSPPYLLAYGSSSVGAAAMDPSAIPAGTLISTASLGSRSALGGESRIAAAGSPFDKRHVLWAVLVMGVAALAARLARDRRRAGRL